MLWLSVYFDSFGDFNKDYGNPQAYFELFFSAFPDAVWLNPYQPFIEHQTKLKQTAKVNALKPATLLTNNVDDAIAFSKNFDAVAVKPIAGGKYTKKLTKPKQIRKVSFKYPRSFQEYIEGTNVRTFVVGNVVFAAEVEADTVDFRTDNFTYIPIELSIEHQHQCLDIARTLGYNWTAIDWIRRDGIYYFLEANFAPKFVYFEEQTGHPITKSIANLLI